MALEVSHGRDTISLADDVLIAEIAPAMLGKLKADSRQQALSRSFLWTVAAAFIIPTLAQKLVTPERFELPPNQLGDWVGLLMVLSMIVCVVCGGVTIVRSFLGQPSMLRDELAYRREHGRWRWDR
jgi:hypothetical protein